jgi:pyrimidine operon attenuation protein/uracil phosphoribosyltransferase
MADVTEEGDYELVLAHRAEMQRAVAAIAHRVAAELGTDLEIVGIRRRGVPLAHFIAAGLAGVAGKAPRVHEIGLRRYTDDFKLASAEPKLTHPVDPALVRDRLVLVVDDLCLGGRTLLAASSHLLEAGAARVSAAVLVCTGHTEVPVRPDFHAFRLEVGDGAIVEARVPPFDEELELAVFPRG